jgi:hypothetical protein
VTEKARFRVGDWEVTSPTSFEVQCTSQRLIRRYGILLTRRTVSAIAMLAAS